MIIFNLILGEFSDREKWGRIFGNEFRENFFDLNQGKKFTIKMSLYQLFWEFRWILEIDWNFGLGVLGVIGQ